MILNRVRMLKSASSSAPWIAATRSASAAHRFCNGWWTFWSQCLNAVGATGRSAFGECSRIQLAIEIRIGQFVAHRQPIPMQLQIINLFDC